MRDPKKVTVGAREWTVYALNRFDVDPQFSPLILFASLSLQAAIKPEIAEDDQFREYKLASQPRKKQAADTAMDIAESIDAQRALLMAGVGELRDGIVDLASLDETEIDALMAAVLTHTWGGTMQAAEELAAAAARFRERSSVPLDDVALPTDGASPIGSPVPGGEPVDA